VTDGFRFHDGTFETPATPGLGIGIDEDVYKKKCQPKEIVVS